jgi:hypothetical protein
MLLVRSPIWNEMLREEEHSKRQLTPGRTDVTETSISCALKDAAKVLIASGALSKVFAQIESILRRSMTEEHKLEAAIEFTSRPKDKNSLQTASWLVRYDARYAAQVEATALAKANAQKKTDLDLLAAAAQAKADAQENAKAQVEAKARAKLEAQGKAEAKKIADAPVKAKAEEERIAKLWLKRSIWAAAFIVASLVGMIAFSVASRAPLPPPAEEPSEPAPAARSE